MARSVGKWCSGQGILHWANLINFSVYMLLKVKNNFWNILTLCTSRLRFITLWKFNTSPLVSLLLWRGRPGVAGWSGWLRGYECVPLTQVDFRAKFDENIRSFWSRGLWSWQNLGAFSDDLGKFWRPVGTEVAMSACCLWCGWLTWRVKGVNLELFLLEVALKLLRIWRFWRWSWEAANKVLQGLWDRSRDVAALLFDVLGMRLGRCWRWVTI